MNVTVSSSIPFQRMNGNNSILNKLLINVLAVDIYIRKRVGLHIFFIVVIFKIYAIDEFDFDVDDETNTKAD